MWQTQSKTKTGTLRSRAGVRVAAGSVTVIGQAPLCGRCGGRGGARAPPRGAGGELLERERELAPRRLRQSVGRPGGLPYDPDVDGLDALELVEAFGDRGGHRRREGTPARPWADGDGDGRARPAHSRDHPPL